MRIGKQQPEIYGEPPVRKELARHYLAAMERMKLLGYGNENLRNIIAYQEQEIDCYRDKISELEEELKEKQCENTVQLEPIADGLLVDDGVLRLKPGDTVVLKSGMRFSKESIDVLKEEFKEVGVNVIVLHCSMDAVGIIGNG